MNIESGNSNSGAKSYRGRRSLATYSSMSLHGGFPGSEAPDLSILEARCCFSIPPESEIWKGFSG